MPSLITYERKSLTDSQYHALGVYFTKKRQREREKKRENESSSLEQPTTSTETTELNDEEKIDSPPSAKKPTAKERREEMQKDLDDVEKQLEELETTLASLEKQKHELFEELKGLVHNKKHEEKEKQFSTAPSGLPTFTTQHPPSFPPAGEGLPAVSCSQGIQYMKILLLYGAFHCSAGSVQCIHDKHVKLMFQANIHRSKQHHYLSQSCLVTSYQLNTQGPTTVTAR